MKFKRQEGFRFVFNEPIEAKFVLLSKDARVDSESLDDMDKVAYPCKILDLSPQGIKIYSDAKIGEYVLQPFQLEIHFVLDVTDIKAIGEIVWSKPFGQGKQYGVHIIDQPEIVDLIIREMKERRRKEVLLVRHR
nr:PilZ domain-containing protein [Lysinibacillus timonensis]